MDKDCPIRRVRIEPTGREQQTPTRSLKGITWLKMIIPLFIHHSLNAVYIQTSNVNGERNERRLGAAGRGFTNMMEMPGNGAKIDTVYKN